MFFVRVGSLLAWLGLVLGVLQLIAGIWLGSNLPIDDPNAIAQAQEFYDRRYGATTGEMVTRGIYLILGSVVLGIISEIARKR